MDNISFYLMVLGIAVATFVPRILPVFILGRYDFPLKFKIWLSYVAPAVLGGLTALSVLVPGGSINICWNNLYIWTFMPTILVAWKTRNLFYTMITGILITAILRNMTGLF